MAKFTEYYFEGKKEEPKVDKPSPDDKLAVYTDKEPKENKKTKTEAKNKKDDDDFELGVGINERLVKKVVIRKGKKIKKWKSDRPGYRTELDPDSGRPKEVRMNPAEIRKRIKGQRKGKIKRKAKKAQIQIKRKISQKKRKSLLGKR